MRIDFKAIALWLLMAWLLAFAYFCCVSCAKTVKSVTEVRDTVYIASHTTDTLVLMRSDTLREVVRDTLREVIRQNYTDTIREVQTRIITLRESGDTIREYVYNDVYKYVYRSDSADRYKSVADSLTRLLNEREKSSQTATDTTYISHEKDKEVVKQKKDWKSRIWLGLMGFGIIGAVVYFLRRKLNG